MKKKFLIEIIGLPGGGKTTFINALRQYSNFKIIEPKPPSAILIAFHTFYFLFRLALHRFSTLLKLFIRKDGRWLLFKIGYRIAVHNNIKDSGILSEGGVLQPFISFFAENAEKSFSCNELLELILLIPLPGHLIHFDIPVVLALERYQSREKKGLIKRRFLVNEKKFNNSKKMEKLIVKNFKKGHVLRLDAESIKYDKKLFNNEQFINALNTKIYEN